MKLKLFFFFVLAVFAAHAQTPDAPPVKKSSRPPAGYELPDPKPFAATILPQDMKYLVDTLAAAGMGGRETGEAGQKLAAAFIAAQFKAAGLPPKADRNSYEQKIQLQKESWTAISLKVGDREFEHRKDFYVFPSFNPDLPSLSVKEVTFVGYGIDDPAYSDYGKTDVEGKAIMYYDGEPMNADNKSVITGTDFRSNWSIDWRRKVQVAKKKGAAVCFIIDANFEENLRSNRKNISASGWRTLSSDADQRLKEYTNFVFISPAVAEAIFGKKAGKAEEAIADMRQGDKFKPVSLKAKIELKLDKESTRLEGSNVLGVIEGTDERLKNEFVLVTAHYDHLGQVENVIYHGADDNASGTAAVIEIARAFQEAKNKGMGPKRTVVCMLVSGEEKGLLGSKFYTDFPIFPLDKTVVDINIDMIGRIDEAHTQNPEYIYIIGGNRISTDLHDMNERANETYTQLALDYKYNDPKDPNRYYERSDHYNFAVKGIPVIFYFSGVHPDYHRPTDTADKINFELAAKRAQLAFYTAWDAANRPYRVAPDQKPKE